ncbi:uncharacterized protein EV420DRAFT_1484957 [Desarmillaria tabescens]|uniref:Uncharacterized protein n=1 Tax=Armillaria tabescens TaxID=1929756 RepID=A0AA39MR01_ARMTA|nr:uncharacterized protein EV420DRAFT_1484957 [Desarmillaria tabescens]KAK0443432.1 hypothetical protein EV420DRAFT_1484957 [Desarmillaria tabescens]
MSMHRRAPRLENKLEMKWLECQVIVVLGPDENGIEWCARHRDNRRASVAAHVWFECVRPYDREPCERLHWRNSHPGRIRISGVERKLIVLDEHIVKQVVERVVHGRSSPSTPKQERTVSPTITALWRSISPMSFPSLTLIKEKGNLSILFFTGSRAPLDTQDIDTAPISSTTQGLCLILEDSYAVSNLPSKTYAFLSNRHSASTIKGTTKDFDSRRLDVSSEDLATSPKVVTYSTISPPF